MSDNTVQSTNDNTTCAEEIVGYLEEICELQKEIQKNIEHISKNIISVFGEEEGNKIVADMLSDV